MSRCRNVRWTDQECSRLLSLAGRREEGTSIARLSTVLASEFPTRSREAVRLRLKALRRVHPTWGGLGSGDPITAATGASAPVVPNNEWSTRLLEVVMAELMVHSDESLGSHELLQLVRDFNEGKSTRQEAAEGLERLMATSFPHVWQAREQRPSTGRTLGLTRKKVRRVQYAKVQSLYKRRTKDAADMVLSGDWSSSHLSERRQPEGQSSFWRHLFEQKSVRDERPVQGLVNHWQVLEPITANEVKQAAKAIGDSAAGMDKVNAGALLTKDLTVVAQLFNVMLLLEMPTQQLSKARVTLIPKAQTPSGPSDYRPIAVSSVVLRILHKIMAQRMMKCIKLERLQVAFQKRDGCMEAAETLNACLREAQEKSKNLAAAFVDVSKAFDTVSHDSILRAAQRQGFPPPLLNYLRRLYDGSTVQLCGEEVRCRRGVRQGDPLSPILFIAVIDDVLSSLPCFGFPLGSERIVDVLAYADDLVLFTENEAALQSKLNGLADALALVGMTVNASKSRALTITANKHNKTVVLRPVSYTIGNSKIRGMSVSDRVQYLGLSFGWKGKIPVKHTGVLEGWIKNVTQAPLKPYQRMSILRNHIVPRLLHGMVLGAAHRNTLKAVDIMLRQAVKAWLRLPKDTTSAFLHGPVNAGGLGIPCLSVMVPLAQRKRLENLARQTDPTIGVVREKECFRKFVRQANLPIQVGSKIVLSKEEARKAWADALVESKDGRALEGGEVDSASHSWVREPSKLPAKVFIRGVKLRGGLLPTKVRAARGRAVPQNEVICKGRCGQPESIDHILQSCPITHDVRCERHDRVVRKLGKELSKTMERVWLEPIVPSGSTFCKPRDAG
ncbi:Retrovirus Pol polyprotein from type-2 retrotransposable element R2DM [Fasciolopsis buskii]|uniref:Retrovirus Pol polyprotein from type-2 retrotransposable element R2DM n=1 Tax=Fasciolopsis buskii TaxID=27845 RepID=A0A8E0VM06_9TREM|nr:Retrovirus Pol polyprotein from type-2 retrotransposable element R2DM [Fasciolopsis buski]